MKAIYFSANFCLLMFAFFLFSCSSKQEIIEAKHSNGKPKVVGIYKDSIKTSEIHFYENGQKELEGSYNEKLQRNGHWYYWYEDGKVWSECEFKNGMKEGKSTVFYENGQKRYEGNYRSDSTIGHWQFWDEQGKLIKEVDY